MFFRLIAFTSLFILTACVTHHVQAPTERGRLFENDWYLVSMDRTRREDMPKYAGFTLRLEKDRLSGKAFNSFSVDATVFSDGTMKVGSDMITTRMLPMGRERVLEELYLAHIGSATKWNKVNGQLIVSTGQGKLIFRQ